MPDERKKDETPEEQHPIDPPVRDDERYRLKNAEVQKSRSQKPNPADQETDSKD